MKPMKKVSNQKGFAVIAIPLTLAIIGLIGTGAFAGLDHKKGVLSHHDSQRARDALVIQEKLSVYHSVNKIYPVQKDETKNGQNVLKEALGQIPQDPSAASFSYIYWSDGHSYTLRYFKEATHEEVVVFSQ